MITEAVARYIRFWPFHEIYGGADHGCSCQGSLWGLPYLKSLSCCALGEFTRHQVVCLFLDLGMSNELSLSRDHKFFLPCASKVSISCEHSWPVNIY